MLESPAGASYVERVTFDLQLILDRRGRDVRICDIGGGSGLFAMACASLGMQATLVDDFFEFSASGLEESLHAMLDSYGVRIIRRDIVKEGVNFRPGEFDIVTSFHTLEHLHASPKALYRQLVEALDIPGLFVLAGPNCVNLRKRLTVLFGHGSWSSMEDWYEAEIFRAHVREPSVQDLRYIANDLELSRVEILGANFLGKASQRALIRRLAQISDRPLRLRPSLCSDLYLAGEKTANDRSEYAARAF